LNQIATEYKSATSPRDSLLGEVNLYVQMKMRLLMSSFDSWALPIICT